MRIVIETNSALSINVQPNSVIVEAESAYNYQAINRMNRYKVEQQRKQAERATSEDPLNLFATWKQDHIEAVNLAVKQWLDTHSEGGPLDCYGTPKWEQMVDILQQSTAEYDRRRNP